MITKSLGISAAVLSVGLTFSAPGPAVDLERSAYVWADSCRECHSEIYQAWTKTKHKKAFERLGFSQRGDSCARCHVTGFGVSPQTELEANKGVQCEACHGPALSHVAGATADLLALTEPLQLPGEQVCRRCHCNESPHFQWFDYKTMRQFVHPAKTSVDPDER